MAILLTGGTGKTSVRVARFLQDAKIPFLLASRRGEAVAPSGMPAVRFDWLDASTSKNPFQYEFPGGESISAVYLVAPEVPDPAPSMNAFVDYAVKEHGVKRFVILGGSSTKIGGPHVGKVWQHCLDIAVEYCVLRPTWFMENWLGGNYHSTITGESKICTACGDGKIPFISATDIAAVAFRALTDQQSHNTDHALLGPERLTYDEVAAKFGSSLGREILHVKCFGEQRTQQLMSAGMPEYYAKFLAFLETSAAGGEEDKMNDTVESVIGQLPQTVDSFIQQHKSVWQ